MLLEHFLQHFDGGSWSSRTTASSSRRPARTRSNSRAASSTMFPGDVDCYPRQRRRAPRARSPRQRHHALQAQAARNVHRQEPRQGQHGQPGPQQGQAARKAAADRGRRRRGRRCGSSFPEIEPRQGPAVRTEQLAIGYPDRTVAKRRPRRNRPRLARRRRRRQRPGQDDVPPHDLRLARAGRRATSTGATAARSASTPSTSTRRCPTTTRSTTTSTTRPRRARTTQQIKDVAGSFLFSGELIEKKIRVLSGGERARLVLAGLLLEAAQRAGARRTGQPSRRRNGRGARRRARRATRAR